MSVQKTNYVVIPGWTRSHRSYVPLINSAPTGTNVIVARHPKIIPSGNLKDFIKGFSNFLDEHKLDKVHLIGHSTGGALALLYANQYPDRVTGMTLVSSAGVKMKYTTKELASNFWKHLREGEKDAFLVTFKNLESPWKLLMHTRLAKLAITLDLTKDNAKLFIPTTIIGGDKDRVITPKQLQILHQSLPIARLISFPGRHDLIYRQPELIWQEILKSHLDLV